SAAIIQRALRTDCVVFGVRGQAQEFSPNSGPVPELRTRWRVARLVIAAPQRHCVTKTYA
ncbi:MAG: hypothetical protein O7G29_06255, partial [Acidobacteria bacterium]|nr:hypothetical protein [Acidobacteriota bacterium]